MVTVDAVLTEAYAFRGQPYVFGGEISSSSDPHGVGPVDCSELVEVATRRAGVGIPDGAYNQWKYCGDRGLHIPVNQARSTRGALLFYDDGSGTGRDRVTHVAFSEGNGLTFEAWQESKPVGNYDANRSKFTIGALIPNVDYGDSSLPPDQGNGGGSGGSLDMSFRNLYETDPRMKGDDVKAAQILLRGWGFDPGEIDGVWGPACTGACRGFQGAVGVTVDGQFGPNTRNQANGA